MNSPTKGIATSKQPESVVPSSEDIQAATRDDLFTWLRDGRFQQYPQEFLSREKDIFYTEQGRAAVALWQRYGLTDITRCTGRPFFMALQSILLQIELEKRRVKVPDSEIGAFAASLSSHNPIEVRRQFLSAQQALEKANPKIVARYSKAAPKKSQPQFQEKVRTLRDQPSLLNLPHPHMDWLEPMTAEELARATGKTRRTITNWLTQIQGTGGRPSGKLTSKKHGWGTTRMILRRWLVSSSHNKEHRRDDILNLLAVCKIRHPKRLLGFTKAFAGTAQELHVLVGVKSQIDQVKFRAELSERVAFYRQHMNVVPIEKPVGKTAKP